VCKNSWKFNSKIVFYYMFSITRQKHTFPWQHRLHVISNEAVWSFIILKHAQGGRFCGHSVLSTFKYIAKRNGDRTEPCLTPKLTIHKYDHASYHLTNGYLKHFGDKKSKNQTVSLCYLTRCRKIYRVSVCIAKPLLIHEFFLHHNACFVPNFRSKFAIL